MPFGSNTAREVNPSTAGTLVCQMHTKSIFYCKDVLKRCSGTRQGSVVAEVEIRSLSQIC